MGITDRIIQQARRAALLVATDQLETPQDCNLNTTNLIGNNRAHDSRTSTLISNLITSRKSQIARSIGEENANDSFHRSVNYDATNSPTYQARERKHSFKLQPTAKDFIRKFSAFQLRAYGFTGRAARSWVSEQQKIIADSQRHGYQKSAKSALSRGFDPIYFSRFNVNDTNRDDFIALKDYLFVQPLNGKYAKWVRDKISARSIFAPFSNLFDEIHYQLLMRDGSLQILPLSDVAREHGATVVGIADFMRTHGKLVLSTSAWDISSDTVVTVDSAGFIIDGEHLSTDEFEKLLTQRVHAEFHVLGDSRPESSEFSPLSSNGRAEISLTMVNPNGIDPMVSEGFLIFSENSTLREAFRSKGTPVSEHSSTKIIRESKSDAFGSHQAKEQEHRAISNSLRISANGDLGLEEDEHDVNSDAFSLVSRVNTVTGELSRARSVLDGQLYEYQVHPVSGIGFPERIAEWQQIVAKMTELCKFAPQLRFVEFRIILTEQGLTIVSISATPTYPQEFPFSRSSVEFLRSEIADKSSRSAPIHNVASRWVRNSKLKIRREFAKAFYPRGLVPYQSVRWIGDMKRDFISRNNISIKDKLWAYRHGFLSYRLPQYGVTDANRESFISDFEYRWLRHINKTYKYWLEDKISIKYIAAQFGECLPEYYMYTTSSKGQNVVVPMMDLPAGYEPTFEAILDLAQTKSVLALKPAEGSHGHGFYRLEWVGGSYSLNGRIATADEVLSILKDSKNQYLVTEYIQMHPVLSDIYPYSVNTIRVIVFKKDGLTSQIGNTYLRIGSSKSGYVDNTAAGGMLAEIDAESGRFGAAKALVDGRIVDCPVHPDTGVKIEGTIPHWSYLVSKVLQIADSLPQLEFLGFDVAVTDSGIKIPEINRSPDFPRIDKLTPETIDYLLYKLKKKKQMYGYDRIPSTKLFSLPKRKEN